MDFVGMGMGEIVLILVIGLIVWGPTRIVEISRTLGKVMRTLKKATYDLTAEVTRELDSDEKHHLPPPREENKP
jgi:sec-independent protein translocase protein TatA